MSLPNVVLGLLEQPATGYELKQVLDRGARHFWAAEQSQIYRALRELEEQGLVVRTAEASDVGPTRQVYERTVAGTAALFDWVTSEPQLPDERVGYVAQLFFAPQVADESELRDALGRTRNAFLVRLTSLLAVETRLLALEPSDAPKTPATIMHAAAVKLGIARNRAVVDWCDQTIAVLNEGEATHRTTPRKAAQTA